MHQRQQEEPRLPRQLIDGLLYEKTKIMISGPPKMRKSWLAADLALSLCLGDSWMGFDTVSTRVLFLNMEIPGIFLDWRLYMMEEARQIIEVPEDSFTILNLRGSNALDGDWKELAQFCEARGPFGAIFIDPIYKVFGEREENSARDMAALLRQVDMVSEISGAAIVEIHHFAKGNSSEKDVGDRASGSGVFFRDPDAFMTVSYANKQKLDNEARVDFRNRLVPIIQPFGIRWANFRWQRDADIDLTKPEEEKRSKEQLLLQILKDNPQGLAHGQWQKIAEVTFGIPRSTFNNVLERIGKQIKLMGKLYKIKI